MTLPALIEADSFGEESAYLLGTAQNKWRTPGHRDLSEPMTLKCIDQHCVGRAMLHGTPNAQGQPSAWDQHPVHLAQGGWSIRKKLQPLLTEDEVERCV